MSAGRDWQSKANQLNDCDDGDTPEELLIPEEKRQRVARLIAGWPGHDVETATELMLMLGVHPKPPEGEDQHRLTSVPVSRVMV